MDDQFSERPLTRTPRVDFDDDAPRSIRSFRQYRIPPATIVAVMRVFLVLSIFAALVGVVTAWMQYDLLHQVPIDPLVAETNDLRMGIVAIANLIVRLIAGVVFFRWVYVTKANVHGFGARNLQFTPGWSVGWYFIPFLNLIRPFQAVRETWQASRDPRDWKSVSGFGILYLWWTLSLGTAIATNILGRSMDERMPIEGYRIVSMGIVIVFCAYIVLDLVSISIVATIHRFQEEWVHGYVDDLSD